MAAKRRARQLAILLAVAALLVTAPGPAAGDGRRAGGRGRQAGPVRPGARRRRHPPHRRQGAPAPAARRPHVGAGGRGPAARRPAVVPDRLRPGRRPRDPRRRPPPARPPARPGAVQRLGPPADGLRRRQVLQPPPDRAAPDGQPAAGLAARLRPARASTCGQRAAGRRQRPAADTATATRTTGALAGVRRVWLDGRVRATDLDPNVAADRRAGRLGGRLHRQGREGRRARHRHRRRPTRTWRRQGRGEARTSPRPTPSPTTSATARTSPRPSPAPAPRSRRRRARASRPRPTCSSARCSTTTAPAASPGSSPGWSGPPAERRQGRQHEPRRRGRPTAPTR